MADTADNAATAAGEDLAAVMERVSRTTRSFSAALVSGLKSAVGEGRQLDGVLQKAALRLSASVLTSALKPVEDLIGEAAGALGRGLGTGLFAARLGAVVNGGRVQAFASGGVVASPTFFPLSGDLGLMGEAGPEAIMPLARGSDGRLGVKGGSGGGAQVTFNISTPDVAGFRRAEAQIAGLLARSVARGRRGL
ncbi:phage tail tape measure protein [Pseudoxanthobacter sp.]|uniref:phage tail tape measure protein n=1 Tax=Pseudoxanthobacter sp. TaxID=1925742 RepID=UPI002FDFB99D